MNKKVCHMTSAHSRYDIRIFSKECVSLVNNGYDVTLVVNDDNDEEFIQGVHIISTKFKPKNRLQRFFVTKRKIYNKAIEVDADIYHLHDPDLLPIGNKLKKMGKKVIFDSHEDVPQQIMDKQWIPKIFRNTVSKLYETYEKYSIRKFDAAISVTPNVIARLSKINSNTVMVTNYPIINTESQVKREPSLAICFAGGISVQWCHDKILKAIEQIDNIIYFLAGDGTQEYLDFLKSLTAWNKVNYMGKIPHSEVIKMYSKSIAGVALNQSNQARGEGTLGNTKLFEFMEAKLPVICTNYRLWREIVEGNNCGICVDPENIEEITSAIKNIIENPEQARIMGENGRNAVLEKYNWNTQEEELLRLYKSL